MIVYLHGMPGSPAELELAGGPGWASGRAVFAPDRNAEEFRGTDRLLAAIRERAAGSAVRLVGFSLGAMAAVQVAAGLDRQIEAVDLVSPAAPLGLGDFLPEMAGGAVFRLARDHPGRFDALVKVQAVLARIAPAALARAMLRGAAGGDARLAVDPNFRHLLARILHRAFAAGAIAYRSEIKAYVGGWSLPKLTCPITVWQGDRDTWTPPEMGARLAQALGPAATLRSVPGGSHYSTLAAFFNSAAS